ncbi:MAG: DUF2599 domain-containing protein [Erysipelotrichaceae bacterium]
MKKYVKWLLSLSMVFMIFVLPVAAEENEVPEGFRPATQEEKEYYREEGVTDIDYIKVLVDGNKPQLRYAVGPYVPSQHYTINLYFSNVSWLYRSNIKKYSLSMTPRNGGQLRNQTLKNITFNAFLGIYYNGPRHYSAPWKSAAKYNASTINSMYNQYVCHIDFQQFKNSKTWNIEPAKPDKTYWGFANYWNQCN